MISFAEFQKIELRAAKVLKVEHVAGKDKLYRLEVDVGAKQPRTLVAGLKPHYEIEKLVGKTIVVASNLAPAKIAGIESNGMLLAADLSGEPVLLTFDRNVPAGTVVR